MKDYEVIILDADGTILDSELGITKSVQIGLSKIGIEDNDFHKFKGFMGPPMVDSFMKICGLTYDEAIKAMEFSRVYIAEHGLYESSVYPGIIDLLETLKKNKKRIMIATAKPSHFTEESLKFHKLSNYFEIVEASPATGNEDIKSKIIKRVLDRLPDVTKSKIVMVGDREHDIIGARENNIDSIAVTYGYGSTQELSLSKPTAIANTVEELKAFLI